MYKITAIIIIILVIAGAGYWIYQSNLAPQESPESISDQIQKPKDSQPTSGQIIVKQSGGAGILITECGDKKYITDKADYIIEGVVLKSESKWNEGKTSIFTYSDVSIEKYVKGTPLFTKNTIPKIQIVTPGGTVGEISEAVENEAVFHEGKKIRIYFQQIDGEFVIVCAQFGVEEI